MPQMAPSMWLNILILTSTMILMANSMIYFQSLTILSSKNNLNYYYTNWKWQISSHRLIQPH